MTTRTIYIPRLIESAEQAEALPVGTIALLPTGRSHRQVLTKTTDRGPGPWDLDMHGYGNGQVVGWTALVPIEAEEVIGTEFRHQLTDKRYDIHVMRSTDMDNARWQVENNPKSATGRIMRQYRTPWEEA